jgi:hypothetical protein
MYGQFANIYMNDPSLANALSATGADEEDAPPSESEEDATEPGARARRGHRQPAEVKLTCTTARSTVADVA